MDKNEVQTAAYFTGSRTVLHLHMQLPCAFNKDSPTDGDWTFWAKVKQHIWDLKTPCQIPLRAKPETAGDFSLAFALPAACRKSLHAFQSTIFISYLDFGSHLCCTYTVLRCTHAKGSQQWHRRRQLCCEELGGGEEGSAFPSLHQVVIHLS